MGGRPQQLDQLERFELHIKMGLDAAYVVVDAEQLEQPHQAEKTQHAQRAQLALDSNLPAPRAFGDRLHELERN